jgi:outer membrane protein
MNKKSSLILGATLLALSGAAAAQATHTFYLGAARIDVRSKAPALQGGDALPAPGALLHVGDADTIGFGYVYRFAPSWSAELALGLPPSHKVYGDGVIKAAGQIAVVEQMPPTAFINYHFGEILPKLHPFVGVGINYTHFSKTRSTPSGDAITGGPTRITLTDSWGAAGHVGLNVQYSKNWSLVTTIAMADVKSDQKAYTQTRQGEVVRSTRVDFRPIVYTLSLGYSF